MKLHTIEGRDMADVVTSLETIIERIRSGDVSAIVLSCFDEDGRMSSIWRGPFSDTLALAARLGHQINVRQDGDS